MNRLKKLLKLTSAQKELGILIHLHDQIYLYMETYNASQLKVKVKKINDTYYPHHTLVDKGCHYEFNAIYEKGILKNLRYKQKENDKKWFTIIENGKKVKDLPHFLLLIAYMHEDDYQHFTEKLNIKIKEGIVKII